MELLFITRKVDRSDPRTGFVHGWINSLSAEVGKNGGSLLVLCQEKGDVSGLSDGIEVFSMGKEVGRWKIGQLWKFKRFVWRERARYQAVFVHMMPLYANICGLWCKLLKKPLYLWYVHKSVDWMLKLTRFFVSAYFTASKESFRMNTRVPIHVVGHGIDVEKFQYLKRHSVIASERERSVAISLDAQNEIASSQTPRSDNSIQLLTVGRISPVKNIHLMIEAVKELASRGRVARLIIVGEPALDLDREYDRMLRDRARELGGCVEFVGGKSQEEIVSYDRSADIFLSLSETGSLDKAVLEAMASGCLVLTSNEAFQGMLKDNPECYCGSLNVDSISSRIEDLMSLGEYKRLKIVGDLRETVVERHSLTGLMKAFVENMRQD